MTVVPPSGNDSFAHSFTILGFYKVLLESHNVFAELTVAGVYTGVHRFTYNNPLDKKYILFDITHSVQEVKLSLC